MSIPTDPDFPVFHIYHEWWMYVISLRWHWIREKILPSRLVA